MLGVLQPSAGKHTGPRGGGLPLPRSPGRKDLPGMVLAPRDTHYALAIFALVMLIVEPWAIRYPSKQPVSPFVTFRPFVLAFVLAWGQPQCPHDIVSFFSGLFWGFPPKFAPSLLHHRAFDGFVMRRGGFVRKRGLPTAPVGS